MPTYTFNNTKTNEQYDLAMPYSELDRYLEDNPDIHQVFRMNLVDPVGIGVTKPPEDFMRNIVGRIKDKTPGAHKPALEKRWTVPREH